jgi:hypothetical protein
MFEDIDWRDHSVRTLRLPVPELCIDAELPSLIRAVQHGEAMLFADKHAAIAEMHYRQVAPVQESDRFGLDAWAVLQAEVGALLEVSAALAHNAISDALALRDRIPAVADLLQDGTLTVRQAKIVIDRTNLIDDDSDAAVQVNAALAASLSRPGSWSDARLRNAVDRLVGLIDPDAVKRRRERAHGERGVRFSALEDGDERDPRQGHCGGCCGHQGSGRADDSRCVRDRSAHQDPTTGGCLCGRASRQTGIGMRLRHGRLFRAVERDSGAGAIDEIRADRLQPSADRRARGGQRVHACGSR